MKNEPLWQLEENLKSKKLLLKSTDDDIERATKRRSEIMGQIEEYERAVNHLKGLVNG